MFLLYRSWSPWKSRTRSHVPFSELREFVVGPEFEIGVGDSFVWHLFAINRDGRQIPMTWHLQREPVWAAAIHASEVSGKPVREQPDALLYSIREMENLGRELHLVMLAWITLAQSGCKLWSEIQPS